MLLLHTPPKIFEHLIPWLLLFATVVFALSPLLTRKHRGADVHSPWQFAAQFVVSIYGGYFGAGMGILMLAILSFSGLPNLNAHERREESALASSSTAWRVVPFLIAGMINWRFALLMAVFAMIGGYFGRAVVSPRALAHHALIVLAIGAGMSAYFFVR